MSSLASLKNEQVGLKAHGFMFAYLCIAILPRGHLLYWSLRVVILGDSEIMSFIPLAVSLLAMVFHTALSVVIQRNFFKARKKKVVEALSTLLAPPLTMDWDRLHREQKLPFNECFAVTKRVVLLHNIMTFFGNMVMGVALLTCYDFDTTQ